MKAFLSGYLKGRPFMVVEQLDQAREAAAAMAEQDTAAAAAVLKQEVDMVDTQMDDGTDDLDVPAPADTTKKHGSNMVKGGKKAAKVTPKKEKAESTFDVFFPNVPAPKI